VRRKIGHMVVDCYAAEAVVSVVAGLVDAGFEDYAVEAAISKVYATEALWRTVDEGLQIAGGNGFMCEFPYERMLRDCRINRIFEGTNDILRLFIALNGMDGVASQLKDLMSVRKSLFSAPIKGFGVLQDYAAKHAQLATGAKRQGTHFTKLSPQLGKHAEAFEQSTRELASAVDRILRKHGKEIIGKQFASNRLAEIMIDLFVWACCLRPDKAASEVEIAQIFAGQVKGRVLRNFRKIDDNDDEAIKQPGGGGLRAGWLRLGHAVGPARRGPGGGSALLGWRPVPPQGGSARLGWPRARLKVPGARAPAS
jgi:acyl-CoA dehydrogenase family protein 9